MSPTPVDIILDDFRKAFPCSKVYVSENFMTYRFKGMDMAKIAADKASALIAKNNWPLAVVQQVCDDSTSLPTVLTIKYVEQVKAVKRFMEQA